MSDQERVERFILIWLVLANRTQKLRNISQEAIEVLQVDKSKPYWAIKAMGSKGWIQWNKRRSGNWATITEEGKDHARELGIRCGRF